MGLSIACCRPRRGGDRVLLAVLWAIFSGIAAAAADTRSNGALMVLDANSGRILHATAPDAPRHPASLAKLMLLYLTFERIEQGRLDYHSKIRLSANAAAAAPSKLDLEAGEEIQLLDALKALITKSANDVAIAIAEHIAGSEEKFVGLMNQKARALGMTATTFRNASGLPDDEQLTTARDMVRLALHLEDDFPKHYPLFATRTFTYKDEIYRNHNTLLFHYPGTDGLKTGYTRASGFNLVASVRRGRKHVIGVVFGGTSASSRDWEMRSHLNRALSEAASARTRLPAPVRVARASAARERQVLRVPTPKRAVRPPPTPAPVAEAPLAPTAQSEPPAAAPAVPISRVRQVLLGEQPRAPRAHEAAADRPDAIEALLALQSSRDAQQEGQSTSRFAAGAMRPPAAPPASTPQASIPVATPSAPSAAETAPRAGPLPSGEQAGAPREDWVAATAPAAAKSAAPAPPLPAPPAVPAEPVGGGFQIQIGAYQTEAEAQRQLALARERAPALLGNRAPLTQQAKQGERLFFRARYAGFARQTGAEDACNALKRLKIDCLVVKGQ